MAKKRKRRRQHQPLISHFEYGGWDMGVAVVRIPAGTPQLVRDKALKDNYVLAQKHCKPWEYDR
jgi:hypothetical protein